MIHLWWHEPSNYLDIALPDGNVWRNENTLFSKWHKFKLHPQNLTHAYVHGWVYIGEL